MKLPGSVASLALDMGCASHAGPPGLAMRQQRRLKGLLGYAQQHSPYYRDLYADLDLDTVALQNLPTVTKTALMAAFDDWVTRPQIRLKAVQDFVQQPDLAGTPYRGDLFVCTSSGTTGHPGIFLHDAHAVAVYRAISFARINRAWLGARQWLGLAQRGLRWANIMGTGGHFGGTGWMELERQRSAWKHQAYRVVSVQRPLRDIVAELNAFTPTIVSGYASVMDQLAGEQLAGRLHLRPVLVEIAGESPTPEALPRMAACVWLPDSQPVRSLRVPFHGGQLRARLAARQQRLGHSGTRGRKASTRGRGCRIPHGAADQSGQPRSAHHPLRPG